MNMQELTSRVVFHLTKGLPGDIIKVIQKNAAVAVKESLTNVCAEDFEPGQDMDDIYLPDDSIDQFIDVIITMHIRGLQKEADETRKGFKENVKSMGILKATGLQLTCKRVASHVTKNAPKVKALVLAEIE